ncbi:flagellar basal body L-ring protein FlgH [Caballeronia mineralivorans]|jgi:flagellar L-ring protein precursor FlgH|uniref:flagellar basal body L-ring protein FlgH n=1 Tax=Caballeronia mineralivorans TaxID=2010198 RepID=UPI0023F05246|nr:flagellar basal body L-ring protein FlgH [Caballeronia mineralivorans]MDB5784463.1 Flagellar L-ring protein [Caballeronia mineralivorans]MEA3097020.1 flagellar L-ring protein FlgH [Caballeronia mineralivorans]
MNSLKFVILASGLVSLAGCAGDQQKSIVDMPTFAPVVVSSPLNIETGGAIFQGGNTLAFYETPRAQHVGDVLTIRLAESYSANNSDDASADRSSDITAEAADKSTNAAAKLAKLFNVGSASTTFKGKGAVTNTTGMTGTLAVSVIATLPTGNLVVAGDKIIATNSTRDRLRLSGIVNPKDIEVGNYVSSSKVANARIEQAGVGMLADATTLGWLQRMFLSVLTF